MSRAEIYDGQFAKGLPLEWETQILQSNLKPKGKTLDVGCGTGRLLLHLSGKGLDLFGVDVDKEFVYAARDKLRNKNVDAVLVIADAHKLPFKNNAFDNVFSTGNLLGEVNIHAKDRQLMLNEIATVTKLNGIIIIEFVHRYWKTKDTASWLWKYIVATWKKIIGLPIEYGDYTEAYRINNRRITLTFHAFTTREAEKLFKSQKLLAKIVRRGRFFHDWFFIIGSKTIE